MNSSANFLAGDFNSEQFVLDSPACRTIQPIFWASSIEEKLTEVNWHNGIPPLRSSYTTFALLTEGSCNHHIGLHTYSLKQGDLIVIPDNYINYTNHINHIKGYCVQFKTEFLLPFVHAYKLPELFPFLDLDANYVLPLNSTETRLMQHLFEEVITAFYTESLEKDNLVRSYLYILLLKLKEIYTHHFSLTKPVVSRAQTITKQYKLLVEKHFLTKKAVHDYAELLCISAKHLADVIKQTLGKTPGEVIQEMIVLEAKVLLQQTDMTITQIAHHLNFEDQSYFSRFFKKQTLQTPLEYRATH